MQIPSWTGPVLGSLIASVFAVGVAYLVNHRIGRVNSLVHFTTRFHNLIHQMYELNREFKFGKKTERGSNSPKSEDEFKADAMALYRQLFSLLVDEFFALEQGMLTTEQMTEWMVWRVQPPPEEVARQSHEIWTLSLRINVVAGLPQEKAWQEWYSRPQMKGSRARKFLDAIHGECFGSKGNVDFLRKRRSISRIVRLYAPCWTSAHWSARVEGALESIICKVRAIFDHKSPRSSLRGHAFAIKSEVGSGRFQFQNDDPKRN